jgi:hypothetical protein
MGICNESLFMTLWKLRFALEYCKKSRGISKNNAKTMILNGYKQSKLHILIRKHWKQFKETKIEPHTWFDFDKYKFEKHLENDLYWR